MFLATTEINNYSIFLSKIFVHNVEQRFSSWVVNLGFFLSNQTFYEKNLVFEKKNNVWVYFNFRKYFFSFLLLKLFLNFTSFKAIYTRFERFRNNNSIVNFNKYKTFTEARKDNNKTLVLKNFRILFLMTIPAQKLFVDKVFLSQTKHLSILVDQNLIANRYFFYKILLGFHKERKNMIYPQFAKRLSNTKNNFYKFLGFNFFLPKLNSFFISKAASNKVGFFNIWLDKKTSLLKIFLNKLNFITINNNRYANKQIASIIVTDKLKKYFISVSLLNNYLFLIFNFFFTSVISCFWNLFWIKFFFNVILQKDLSTWRHFSINYFHSVNNNPFISCNSLQEYNNISAPTNTVVVQEQQQMLSEKFFISDYFFNFMQKISLEYINKIFRGVSTIKNFSLNNFNHRLLQQSFIENSFIRIDPKKLRDRQALMDKIMLLRFLPITLIVLFISVVNKQILRDVFRMNLPFILISSMDNKNFFSDYSFPGNSFEFNILYFYFKFFLEFFKI